MASSAIKKLIVLLSPLLLGFLALTSHAQDPQSNPVSSFISNGSGGWTMLTSSDPGGAVIANPPPAALYSWNASLNRWVPWTGGGSGPGAGVASLQATPTALFNLNLPSATTGAITITPTINTQSPFTAYGNFTPGTSTPTFGAFPISMLASSGTVSPITNGLVGEYHLNETSGSTVAVDYSGQGNIGAYFGTPTLPGTLAGGMTSAGAGGMDYPAAFNAGASVATTLASYVCSNALATNGSLLPLLIGGLTGSATPALSSLQAFGLMMNATNSNPLSSVVAIGKYDTTPAVYNDTTVPTVAAQSSDGCHLITWVRGTTNDHLYIDGNEVSGYFLQGTGTLSLTPSTGNLSLGMPHYATLPNVSFAYPYPVYFNFVFNRALTAAEIQTLSGSAQSYAQFRGIVKTPTNFTDPGNQILYIGDSITVAINATNPWPRQVTNTTVTPYVPVTAALPGSANNIGTPSWTIGNMIQECQSRGYGSMNPNSSTTAIIWAGTNDIATGTQVTPATAYGRLRRLVQCYKSGPHQPRVFVMTMLSRTGNGTGVNAGSTFDQLHNTYNDLIRQDYAGADGMIDIASFAGLGASGASTNPTTACAAAACFQGDGIHPTTAAQPIIAGYVAGYLNWADAAKNGTNPVLRTAISYTNLVGEPAVNVNPTTVGSQTITLPSAVGLIGTDRYFSNLQATGTNTATITAASGENIDGASTLVCPNATKCSIRAVLGATPGTSTADSAAGAHWEQFGFSGGGGGSSNATSIQSVPVSATAPTSSQVLGYNGTNWIPTTVAGGTVPTGTGYYTITGGAANPTATALPIASSSVQGISNCDNTTITCASGILTAVGGAGNATSLQSVAISATAPTTGQVLGYNGTNWIPTAAGGGGAGLGSNTYTGIQIMPSLQDTVVNDTGLVNVAVLANTSVTALSSGEILTWNPVAANTIAAPTLNVNGLGAKTITKFGNVALAANDLVIGTTAVVIYNSAGSGTWQLLNPATSASTVAPTFTGTTGVSTLNYTSSITKGGGTVHPINACAGAITPTPVSGTSVYTCSVTGGSTSSICQAFPTNAAAQLLWGGTGGAVAPLAGNIPTAVISSGSTVTFTFRTTSNVQAVAGGETFNVQCTIN